MDINDNTKEFFGSCHCGNVRFHCKLETELLKSETLRCNCSYCLKTRFWEIIVCPKDFKVLKGEKDQENYLYGSKINDNYFCKSCGVNTYTLVKMEGAPNAPFYAVNVNTIEGITHEQLSKLKVTFLDGATDNWQNEPKYHNHI
ncbi:hypothetical protein ACTFIV_010285 [Dictyostelium citrinum]